MIETRTRTLIRTLLYRIIALFITAIWTGIGDAVLIHFVLAGLQYALERAWLRVSWGMLK